MATEEAENNAQEDAISEESCIPVEKWKNESVLEFLEAIGLNQLIQLFKEHEITGRDLISLNTQEMREDLQITNLHVRKKLCRQIEKLKGQVGIQGKYSIDILNRNDCQSIVFLQGNKV